MLRWQQTKAGTFELRGDIYPFSLEAEVYGTVEAEVYGTVFGRWWAACHWRSDEVLWRPKTLTEPFPDVDAAKRWCERELAFAGLEEIA